MKPSLPVAAATDVVGHGEEFDPGLPGDDVDDLARLKKTLAALAHVHGIFVRLRERAESGGDRDAAAKK